MRHLVPLAMGFALAACAPARDCIVTIWLVDDSVSPKADVVVIGDFNGWNDDANVMEYVDDDNGRSGWRTQLDLPAGDYRYLIQVDGTLRTDSFAALEATDPGSGDPLSVLRVADCQAGLLEVVQASATADGVPSSRL